MQGGNPPSAPILIAPSGIVERRSSDIVRVDDPFVLKAIQFIRRHSRDRICVGDVVREVGISRRSLESRFAASLGRSPAREILKTRIDVAKGLLLQTNLKLQAVAASVGFRRYQAFFAAFGRQTGMTPGNYRRTAGSRGGALAQKEMASSQND